MPSRVRLHRPDHWRDETTSRLRPDVRDAYFGLSTLADDAGFLLWRPATLAAALYPYEPAARRESDLVRRADALQAVDLLIVASCGCALIPRMRRDLSTRGGILTTAVAEFHVTARHPNTLPTDDYVALRRAKDGDSDSLSSSDSSSESATGEGAGGGAPGNGHDERFERRRRAAIAGIRDGTITGLAAERARVDYGIGAAEGAGP